jgi:hypothetical protein
MNDWTAFTEAVPWFLDSGAKIELSQTRVGYKLSQADVGLFPPLAKLFAEASVTTVSINGTWYELLAWNGYEGQRMGWLCLSASDGPSRNLFAEHRELLASFGGIVERFNEPENTWLLNLNDALTEREAAHDAKFVQDYSWAFESAGLTIPMELTEYYSIAREANGNATLCHRNSGKLLMFAPDHCFAHLKTLEGCPEHTLYTIKGADVFRDWVNGVALQWLAHLGPSA